MDLSKNLLLNIGCFKDRLKFLNKEKIRVKKTEIN
jgi:hypothetical protein